MVVASYESNNGIYDLVRCELDDIDSDMAKVDEILEPYGEVMRDRESYAERMINSIYQDLAFAIVHNGVRIGFMYYMIDSKFPRNLIACSFYVNKDMVALMILIGTIDFTGTYKLLLAPHGNSIETFKSLISKNSLRKYNAGLSDYVILARNVKALAKLEKFNKLLNIRKIEK